MTSAKKIAANRVNARKSRGPQTKAGKRIVSRNALRHGLSAFNHRDPVLVAEIEQMAKAICGDDRNPLLLDQARVIAQSELVLQRVRLQKVAVIERLYDTWTTSLSRGDTRLALADIRSQQATIAYEEFSQLVTKLNKEGKKFWTMCTPREVKPDEPPAIKYEPRKERDEHDALRDALPDLAPLLRYERRAWSRRKRALYQFIALKMTSGALGRYLA
jgi:hypothetical protein